MYHASCNAIGKYTGNKLYNQMKSQTLNTRQDLHRSNTHPASAAYVHKGDFTGHFQLLLEKMNSSRLLLQELQARWRNRTSVELAHASIHPFEVNESQPCWSLLSIHVSAAPCYRILLYQKSHAVSWRQLPVPLCLYATFKLILRTFL